MLLIVSILFLIFGIIFLVKGSGVFVSSASRIAKKLGVSDFIIGLTLVALGTSLPELTSSIVASVKQEGGLILGTIIGANIANLTLIIGIAAVLSKIKVEKEVLKRDGYVLLFVVSLLLLFLLDGVVSRIEGVIFLMLYMSYTLFLIELKSKIKKDYDFSDFAKYFIRFGYAGYIKKGLFLRFPYKNKKPVKKNHLLKHYLFLALGLVLVYFSAEVVVSNAVKLAEYFKVAPLIIGILISIGTTLPELSVSISASKKKHGNVAIGNSIGSCITNTLLVLGLAAIIHPIKAIKENVLMTFPYLIISVLLVLFFIKTDFKISKKEGFFLVLFYLIFLIKVLFF